MRLVENADSTGVDNSFSYPHGLSTPAAQVAMIAKRYMHLSGATSKDFGAVSRSPLTITRIRGGSPNRCGCWTAARRPTVRWRWSSRRRSGPGISSTGRRSSRLRRRGRTPATFRIGEPGDRRRACARHRRHRRADLGSHPWADACKHLFVRGHACTGQLPSRCRSRFGSESSPNPGSPLGEVAKRMRWARDDGARPRVSAGLPIRVDDLPLLMSRCHYARKLTADGGGRRVAPVIDKHQ
jgi:hypothetical protein